MKIGIITFHRAHNYGAVLQCMALSKVLAEYGHKVEVVDYYPSYLRSEYKLLPSIQRVGFVIWIKSLIKTIPILRIRLKRMKLFNSFIKTLPLSTKQYTEKDKIITGYDVLIFGSDQIWNPLLSQDEDAILSGFFRIKGTKFVSYAASTNPVICNAKYRDYFKRIIDSFDAISVRELVLADYLNSIKPNVAKTVLDPVLLLSKYEWEKIAINPKEKDYLLIYTVPQSPLVRKHAEFVARQKGLQIIELTPKARNVKENIYRQIVSPNEFVGYFKNASYVVTTSFHGTAFSIRFNKQFSTIQLGSSVDNRAYNLLNSLDLQNRAITETDIYKNLEITDYEAVNSKLEEFIRTSLSYLKNSCVR